MLIAERAPKGVMTSDAYEVTLVQGEARQTSDVYLTICPDAKSRHDNLPEELRAEFNGISDGGPDTIYLEKAYYTGFTTDAETQVRVRIRQDFDRVEVIGKDFALEGDEVTFAMQPGEKTILLVGDDFGRHLCVSADREYAIPQDAARLIELRPGLYTEENCAYISKNAYGFPVFTVPDDTVVYLHRGAVIQAAVLLENAHNVKIVGNGSISTVDRCYGADRGFDVSPKYAPLRKGAMPAIYIKTNSSDIVVEGVTLSCEFRGIVMRNSKNISVDNVKLFTGCINSDGINMMNVDNVKVSNSVVVTADDCIAVFTACDSIAFLNDAECIDPTPYTGNVEIADCILATAARTFCIGGHSTGSKTPHDLVENLYAHDIKAFRISNIAYPVEHAAFWSGPLRILSQTEQYIRNIKLENITVRQHPVYCGKLIHLEVRSDADASYTETNGYRIENVEISNVDFIANSDIVLPCLVKSQSEVCEEGYCVDGVRLKNIRIDGKPLVNTEEFLIVTGPVENLTVE